LHAVVQGGEGDGGFGLVGNAVKVADGDGVGRQRGRPAQDGGGAGRKAAIPAASMA
jgi:hypothetical protein